MKVPVRKEYKLVRIVRESKVAQYFYKHSELQKKAKLNYILFVNKKHTIGQYTYKNMLWYVHSDPSKSYPSIFKICVYRRK